VLYLASARENSARHAGENPKARKLDSPRNQWSGDRAVLAQATFKVILLAQYFRFDWANLGDSLKGLVVARLLFGLFSIGPNLKSDSQISRPRTKNELIEVLWI
jgi:hypothetical protein